MTALRQGCFLVQFLSDDPLRAFDGTMRVDMRDGDPVASGDLYERAVITHGDEDRLGPPPDPAAGIPVLPLDSYQYYLRVTAISDTDDGIGLTFEAHQRVVPSLTSLDGTTMRWVTGGTFSALLTPEPAPEGFPEPRHFVAGDLTDAAGVLVGHLSMGWVSPYLRAATVEIDGVAASELPRGSGTGVTWRTVFDDVGWDVTAVLSDHDVDEPSGESWSAAEAEATMLARRDPIDLDREWRYHCLAVRRLDVAGGNQHGWMYDQSPSGGSDHLPREGFMIASHWPIPSEPQWGVLQGQRFGSATVAYFRASVHELGHAMGLAKHNRVGRHIMRTTEDIAHDGLGTPDTPFPDNVEWSFSPEDAHRLRHWPDPAVRPGGIPLTQAEDAPISAPRPPG